MSRNTAISVAGLRKTYGDNEVLTGVDLHVATADAESLTLRMANDGVASLRRLLYRLDDDAIAGLTVRSADLDDVFLALTGHAAQAQGRGRGRDQDGASPMSTLAMARSTTNHAVRDSVTILRRNLLHWLRYPSLAIMLVAQPIAFLLRAQVRELQELRRRIAWLAAGDSLAVPPEVVPYLDKLRASGAPEALVIGERDGWILMTARWPEKIPELMVDKMAQLDDPRTLQLYWLIGEMLDVGIDENRLSAVADLLVEMVEESAECGELDRNIEEMSDDAFIALIDSFAADAHPMMPA